MSRLITAAESGDDFDTLALEDMDDWDDFWRENGEFIGYSEKESPQRATQGGLAVGGGAAPYVLVLFTES